MLLMLPRSAADAECAVRIRGSRVGGSGVVCGLADAMVCRGERVCGDARADVGGVSMMRCVAVGAGAGVTVAAVGVAAAAEVLPLVESLAAMIDGFRDMRSLQMDCSRFTRDWTCSAWARMEAGGALEEVRGVHGVMESWTGQVGSLEVVQSRWTWTSWRGRSGCG